MQRPTFTTPYAPTSPGPDAAARAFAAIEGFIQEQLDRLLIPGAALAIVEDDRIVHRHAFGRGWPGGTPPTSRTPFVLGSTTKSITALAVMQLAERGEVDLDAPVRRYLQWFRVVDPDASERMTVRHLLNQTSGFSQIAGWPSMVDPDNRPDAGERQARELATERLIHPLGTAFEYSNVNYNLLGLIVEAVSGQSYGAYVRDHIFAPLGMQDSHATRAEARSRGLARGHRLWFGVPVPSPDTETPVAALPSGQLISSAEDMARYLIAMLNGGRFGDAQILSPAGLAEMHRPVAEVRSMGVSMGRYGMGWFVEDRGGTGIIWHDGLVPDFFSFMAIVPGQRKGIVLLLNAGHLLMQVTGSEVGMGAAERLAGVQPQPVRLATVPWVERSLLTVPIVQALVLVRTLRRGSDSGRDRSPMREVLVPIVPDLTLIAIPLGISRTRSARFFSAFAPDLTWLAILCGALAGLSAVVRTSLALRGAMSRR